MSNIDKISISLSSREKRQLIRDSIEIMNETLYNFDQIAFNPSDFKSMILIAQRMNGFQGSFGFLEDSEHKSNIRELAELAELITEHFSKNELPITEKELIIVEKCINYLSKAIESLKNKNDLENTLLGDISVLLMEGASLIFTDKEKLCQNDVNSLLDDLF